MAEMRITFSAENLISFEGKAPVLLVIDILGNDGLFEAGKAPACVVLGARLKKR
jgi:hypothetical protein